jgi:hypothetical protein
MRLIIVHRNDSDMAGFTRGPIGGHSTLNITFGVLFVYLLLFIVSQKQREAVFAKSLGMSQNREDQQLCTLCNDW